MITFYFHKTPNPMKVALFLEESGLEYRVVGVDTLKGQQHDPEFRKINPNGKLPAIVDEDGTRVFDSNAILLYLADRIGRFVGRPAERGELLSWLMFVATGVGPYSGQAVHFQRMAPERIDYAVNRYRREVQRHYAILDAHLERRSWMVGEDYSIVDMALWGWIDRAGVVLGEGELDAYANLKRHYDAVNARDAVARARNVGAEIDFKSDFDESAKRALFPQNYADAG